MSAKTKALIKCWSRNVMHGMIIYSKHYVLSDCWYLDHVPIFNVFNLFWRVICVFVQEKLRTQPRGLSFLFFDLLKCNFCMCKYQQVESQEIVSCQLYRHLDQDKWNINTQIQSLMKGSLHVSEVWFNIRALFASGYPNSKNNHCI